MGELEESDRQFQEDGKEVEDVLLLKLTKASNFDGNGRYLVIHKQM